MRGVEWTQVIDAAAPTPDHGALSDDFRGKDLIEAKVLRVRERRPVELLVASSIALAGATGVHALSRGSKARFFDETTPYQDLASLQACTNGLQSAAVFTGIAGLGLGTTAAVTW